MNNAQRAAIILFVNALLPFLVLLHVLAWSADTLAGAGVVTTTATGLVAAFFPSTSEAAAAAPKITDPPK